MNCIAQAIGLGPALLFPPNPNSNLNPNDSHSQYRKKCISLLQKCRNSNEITPIHANIIKNGEEDDVFIVFELLRVCSKCNAIDYALKIFKQFSKPNVYLYTALVDGLVLSGLFDHGIRVYMQMIENFVMPDNYVISSVLKACGFYGDLRTGRGIHAQCAKLGLCSNRSVKLKLLEFYGKCGEFENMKRVFDEMLDRDIVALTVMISSYLDYGFVKNASEVFDLVRIKDTKMFTRDRLSVALPAQSSTKDTVVDGIELQSKTSQDAQPSTLGRSKTSIHVTALDGIVNVNSLFTMAIFIGFSLTVPANGSAGHPASCNASIGTVRRLIVFEVISFSFFLFSSLIAQSLKLTINLLNSLDATNPHKADIDSSVMKYGLFGSAIGSVMGCLFLTFSIVDFIQVKLGVLSCGGEPVYAVVTLAVFVGSSLLVYVFTSVYAAFFM
ncbi:unnamed protein product [Fraxinus pennsylvanica]|uniref:Uncharacterized protein n=1 Tax=Fraxinus pennsylvanica TaxID=56036 RepID=A0AAD2E0V5_9LAMI|nr:unnamed protein product [Fraxinus pennsylvanica]